MCPPRAPRANAPWFQFLLEVARQKNVTPLPLIKPYTGPRLPPDRYCLTAPNYRLKTVQKKVGTPPRLGTTVLVVVVIVVVLFQVTSAAGRISVPRLSIGAVSSRPGTPTLGESGAAVVTQNAVRPRADILPSECGAGDSGKCRRESVIATLVSGLF